jgi:two-component system C4-dicarboxylate transport sensor histidine kinase DctB
VAGLLILVLLAWGGGELAARRARADLARQAAVAADLRAAVLRSELEKHRSLPFVLAEDADVRRVLELREPSATAALNRKLEDLARQTNAAVIYVLQPDGLTLAASNWRRPDSFVGSNYHFRPYFQEARTKGASEYFALGTVSRRPGLFLARRVRSPEGGLLGVVVAKVEFDRLESEWARSPEPAFVVDDHGVVLLTSVPEWRFRTLHPIDDATRVQIRQALQFGGAPLAPMSLRRQESGEVTAAVPGQSDRGYVAARTPAAARGWTLHLLTPSDPAVATTVTAARSVILGLGGLVLLAAALLLRRREIGRSQAAAREAARLELEMTVAERTAELRAANERLLVEMEERRRAEAGVEALQHELVQANKLAMLGQIAAGVAHEINQPLAAIRSYADNAQVLLSRREPAPAGENLAAISGLTEKIGAITDELRAFSRKSRSAPGDVALEDALSGALLLVGAAFRHRRVQLILEGTAAGIKVHAERIRLEQVLVNLMQNALEAVEGRPSPEVRLSVQALRREVRIQVSDNGPGLSEAARTGLFTPFNTTKPSGVGLGLVISRDIVREFGGRLTHAASGIGGAAFVVSLRRTA